MSPHSRDLLEAHTNHKGAISRLIAIPGVKIHKRGDSEATVLLTPSELDQVSEVLNLLHRRSRSVAAGATRPFRKAQGGV